MTAAKCAGAGSASTSVASEPGAFLDKSLVMDDDNEETEADDEAADDEGAVLGHRDEAESPPGPSAATTRESGRLGAAVPDTGCIPALLMQSLQRVCTSFGASGSPAWATAEASCRSVQTDSAAAKEEEEEEVDEDETHELGGSGFKARLTAGH